MKSKLETQKCELMQFASYIRRLALLLLTMQLSVSTAVTPVSASTCSLADHIRSANTNSSIGGCPQGTSHDVIALSEDITLSEALPAITGAITIEGGGHTISGDFRQRIFDVNGGRLAINELTLTRGQADNGGAMRLRNGAIASLTNTVFDTNLATDGGAIAMSSADVNLTVADSSFVKNFSEENGGAIWLGNGAEVAVTNTVFEKNRATNGGAISMAVNDVSLTVEGSSFDSNKATEHGGAIHAFRGTATISSSSFVLNQGQVGGGAIYAINRKVTVANSTFAENQSSGGGGAFDLIQGEFTLTHLTFAGNRSATGTGNAIYRISGNVYLRNSILVGGDHGDDCEGGLQQNSGNLSLDGSCRVATINDALLGELTGSPAHYPLLDSSPALDVADPRFCLETDQIGTTRPQGGGCDVGAIESATARPAQPPIEPPPPCPLSDQIIAANTDAPSGGCRAGSGADVISLDRDITLRSRLPAITSDITIEGNGHTISGDKRFHIFNVDGGKLTVNNLILTEGLSRAGGGAIEVQNYGQATINDSQFINNLAHSGGAIAMQDPNKGLTVNNSRFYSNRAQYAGGAIANWSGATIIRNSSFLENSSDVIGGAVDSSRSGATHISRSSFIGNRALRGGAILTTGSGTTDVSNSTFIGNHSDNGGAIYASAVTTLTHITVSGGGLQTSDLGGRMNLRNSIVNTGLGVDICRGVLAQNVGNLISDGSCSPQLSGDPQFGERTGDPVYLPLQVGSPAINAAHPAFCTATDQRGAPRPQGGGCDIGAIEWSATSPAQLDRGTAEQGLDNCTLTTTHVLNFRDGPGGARIGLVAESATVRAMARTAGWFQVEYRGAPGWISADYVETEGECG